MFIKKYNSLLKEKRRFSLATIVFLGLFSGVAGTLIIAIINKVIQLDPKNQTFYPHLFIGFISVLGIYFFVQTFYQVLLINMSHRMVWKLRKKTLDNVRRADYLKYLAFGNNKVHGILTRDAYELSQFSQMISSTIVAAVTLLTGLAYLLWIAPIGCLITLIMAIAIASIQLLTKAKIDKKVITARAIEEEYNKYFLCILDGVKELKLDKNKNDDLFNNYVVHYGEKAQMMWATVSRSFYINGVFGNFFFYGVIALFLFILPLFHKSLLPNSFEYILLILYLLGPTNVVIGSIPSFSFAAKALKRFTELEKLEEIKEVENKSNHNRYENPKIISFHNLCFQYEPANDERQFAIGPLNFELKKGEAVFLTGGNGSGKSTFIRLLTGLYPVHSGAIQINNINVGNTQTNEYRSLFSVVYTDSYLFDAILGFDSNQDERMNQILKDLHLYSKVQCVNNVFTTINLSYGQRKRLSLAVSLLDDKPIYVFDEIAANQDVEFKEYFYKEVLWQLKNKGKIIFVVSHDEKYFHVADKHYKMEMGKFILKEKMEIV